MALTQRQWKTQRLHNSTIECLTRDPYGDLHKGRETEMMNTLFTIIQTVEEISMLQYRGITMLLL